MCELLGLSSRGDVSFRYSLEAFALHGGKTHANKDGWGVSVRSGRETFLVKEAAPANDSPWVRLMESQQIDTSLVLAHVRRASKGKLTLENTHPFKREMGGRVHVFAHNGDVSPVIETFPEQSTHSQPIGDTDSEHAFCLLLERLNRAWSGPGEEPDLGARMQILAEVGKELRSLGTANFLYTDNDFLFVHADKRRYDDDGVISEPRWPGLQLFKHRANEAKRFRAAGVDIGASEGPMTMVASLPLFDEEQWEPIPEGTVLALRDGEIVARVEES